MRLLRRKATVCRAGGWNVRGVVGSAGVDGQTARATCRSRQHLRALPLELVCANKVTDKNQVKFGAMTFSSSVPRGET